jgi:hypothetical protein
MFREMPPKVAAAGLKATTFVDISPAAEWFYSGTDQEDWDYRDDFPSLAPPWEIAWLEFRTPRVINSRTLGKHHGLIDAGIAAMGMRLVGIHVPEKFQRYALEADAGLRIVQENQASYGVFANWGTKEALDERRANIDKAIAHGALCRWILKMDVVFALRNGFHKPWSSCAFSLDPLGKPIIETMFSQITPDFKPALIAGADQNAASWGPCLPFLFAISLLHCKNVSLELVPTSARIQRKRDRRYTPGIRYKRLVVEPMREAMRRERTGAEPGDTVKHALHICRGHFKDYREKGLFGRYKGIYWWEQHVRGDAQYGEIRKDYVVKPELATERSA